MKKLTKKQKRLLGYALIYIINNFDDDISEDLEMTQEELIETAISTGFVEQAT